jgi:hypothetical protein
MHARVGDEAEKEYDKIDSSDSHLLLLCQPDLVALGAHGTTVRVLGWDTYVTAQSGDWGAENDRVVQETFREVMLHPIVTGRVHVLQLRTF